MKVTKQRSRRIKVGFGEVGFWGESPKKLKLKMSIRVIAISYVKLLEGKMLDFSPPKVQHPKLRH
jgi:hypothetical protein